MHHCIINACSPILSTRLKYQINAFKHQVQIISVKFLAQNDFLVIKSSNTNKLLSVVWRYIYLVHPISKECANVYGYLQLKLSPKVGCNFWHSANTSQLKLHWKHVVTKYLSQIIWQFNQIRRRKLSGQMLSLSLTVSDMIALLWMGKVNILAFL